MAEESPLDRRGGELGLMPGSVGQALQIDEAPLTSLPSAGKWLDYLSDEERVVRRHGDDIICEIESYLDGGVQELFVAANQFALMLFRNRDAAGARQICQAEIQFVTRSFERTGDLQLYSQGLQPVVNLVRLDGYAGNFDQALAGLSCLEHFGLGEPLSLHGYEVDQRTATAFITENVRAIYVARAACVVDRCKILRRRGLDSVLLTESDRLASGWPLVAKAGLCHALEAPWLVAALDCVLQAGDAAAPAWFSTIRGLHLAAALSDVDPQRSIHLASYIFHRRKEITGPFQSSLTPIRMMAHLGDTFFRLRRSDEAVVVFTEAEQDAYLAGDIALTTEIRQRLAVLGVKCPGTEVDTEQMRPDPQRVEAVRERLLTRLACL